MSEMSEIIQNYIKTETRKYMNEIFVGVYSDSSEMKGLRDLAEIQLNQLNYRNAMAAKALEEAKVQLEWIQNRIRLEGAEPITWKKVVIEEAKENKEFRYEKVLTSIMRSIVIRGGGCIRYRIREKSTLGIECIEKNGKIYFPTDEIYSIPYITDATFALAVKIGVLIEISGEYEKPMKELLANPIPTLKKMKDYLDKNPWYYDDYQEVARYFISE